MGGRFGTAHILGGVLFRSDIHTHNPFPPTGNGFRSGSHTKFLIPLEYFN